MNVGVLLWIDASGITQWDVYSSPDELNAILKRLFAQNIDPSKMMLAGNMLSWMFPSFHQMRRTVSQNDLLHIKQNDAATEANNQKEAVNAYIPMNESELGWISPKGRFFSCGYGEHTEKAKEIVSSLVLADDIDDASRYLEDNGWLAVYKNSMDGKSLAIGMGREYQHLSSQQLQTIQHLGIDSKIENISRFL